MLDQLENLGMSGAVFADAGSLFGAGDGAEALLAANQLADEASVRASVGASILWNSPLGPLRIDYAFPLLSEDFDDEQQFRFGAATKF